MANYKVAYGKRVNITPAINSGIIPPGCIILTEDSSEIFFYDLSKNLKTYVSKNKFSSIQEARSWVETYDISGEVISIQEGSLCNAYLVNYSKQIIPLSSGSGTSVQADFLIDDPSHPAYIKNKPTSLPIDFIEGLADALASKIKISNKVIPGSLMVADNTGNIECASITAEGLLETLDKKVEIKDTIIKGALMVSDGTGNLEHSEYTLQDIFDALNSKVSLKGPTNSEEIIISGDEGTLKSSGIKYSDIALKEDIIVGSNVASVKLESSGVYLVNIPESVMKYPTIHVYHNGMLLVENIHYTVSDKFITLIGHATYSGDIFSFVGYGSAGNLLDLDVYHQHNNKEVLDHITQDMVDKWNSSTPADGSFVTKEELFDEDGKIFPGLLPEGSIGGLVLGDTEDTAFRGDLGAIAYEHSQEDHAPANAQENKIEQITLGGTSLPIVNKTVNIPVGNQESLGVVKSSTEPNKVFIEEDGTMSVTSIDATKMIVPEGEELILVSGDATQK